jgi:phage anti-repressor protein
MIEVEKQIIGGEEINTVDAYELWKLLENDSGFDFWINDHISINAYEKGVDYIIDDKEKRIMISLDIAKGAITVGVSGATDLSRKTNLNKIRKYLVECEKEERKRNSSLFSKYETLSKKMENILGGCSFFTILGYTNTLDYTFPIGYEKAKELGRKAYKLSNELGYMVTSAPDVRFGKVNAYHEDILDKIFEDED